jgi:predicted Zn-dependent protease
MNREDLHKKFRKALVLWRHGKLVDAATLLGQVVATGSEEPLHLSYHGLLTATVFGNRKEGLSFCERAMTYDPSEPDVAWNLARIHELGGEKVKAIKTLRRGLRAAPGNPRLLETINRMSPRKTPPLSMVDRNHALNKHLGIVLARLGGRYGKDDAAPTAQLSPQEVWSK